MDRHEFLELLARDVGDAEEALEICDPDEPISLETCIREMQYILQAAQKRVRDFAREHGGKRPCP